MTDAQPVTQDRKAGMNWRHGAKRIWLVFSIVWLLWSLWGTTHLTAAFLDAQASAKAHIESAAQLVKAGADDGEYDWMVGSTNEKVGQTLAKRSFSLQDLQLAKERADATDASIRADYLVTELNKRVALAAAGPLGLFIGWRTFLWILAGFRK